MTTKTFNTLPAERGGAGRGFVTRLSAAIDSFVTYRLQRAVPESELQRAQREIKRYRRLMHSQSRSA